MKLKESLEKLQTSDNMAPKKLSISRLKNKQKTISEDKVNLLKPLNKFKNQNNNKNHKLRTLSQQKMFIQDSIKRLQEKIEQLSKFHQQNNFGQININQKYKKKTEEKEQNLQNDQSSSYISFLGSSQQIINFCQRSRPKKIYQIGKQIISLKKQIKNDQHKDNSYQSNNDNELKVLKNKITRVLSQKRIFLPFQHADQLQFSSPSNKKPAFFKNFKKNNLKKSQSQEKGGRHLTFGSSSYLNQLKRVSGVFKPQDKPTQSSHINTDKLQCYFDCFKNPKNQKRFHTLFMKKH